MAFSSFRVWLAVGEFVREGLVPFLYCSFWFMKSGKRVLGSKGEHKASPIGTNLRAIRPAPFQAVERS